NILFLAQADYATLKAERMPLVLEDELRKIADYFEGLAQERNITFIVQASGIAHANAIMWRRAVNNLVINAIRYGEPGTSIRLYARQSQNQPGATVIVENHGLPMQQEEADRMFNRLYRGDKSRSEYTESNGLGLAIVKAIMTLHDGTATAQAFPDGRIRLSLYFPAGLLA